MPQFMRLRLRAKICCAAPIPILIQILYIYIVKNANGNRFQLLDLMSILNIGPNLTGKEMETLEYGWIRKSIFAFCEIRN
jgi:hypothetical protein